MLNVQYYPAIQHPTIKASLFFTLLFSALDIIVFITTNKHYGYGSPLEMHIFPVITLLLLGWTTTLQLGTKIVASYYLFGIRIYTKEFEDVKLQESGIYVILVGLTQTKWNKTVYCYRKELSINISSLINDNAQQ